MINDYLYKLLGAGGTYYINSILETDKAFCIYFTDRFGNDIDELPLCIYKATYTRCEDEDAFDVELNGIECEIPLEYSSYRSKVEKVLIEKHKTDDTLPNEVQISAVINSLFYSGYHDYSLRELYSVCNYLLDLVELYCNEEEKNDMLSLADNEEIRQFFELSDEEKLNCSKNYYFKTNGVKKLDKVSSEMLGMAVAKYNGVSVDKEMLDNIYEKILALIVDSRNEISEENNDIIDKGKLLEEIEYMEKQSLIEHNYCLDATTNLSDRMRDVINEGDSVFGSNKDKFGSLSPFSDLKWSAPEAKND